MMKTAETCRQVASMAEVATEQISTTSTTERPLVTVVILYYKRSSTIRETIHSVIRQDYPYREIILVDNHSQDDLKSVIEPFRSEIRLIELPENLGACGGRNAGIRAARGQILIFLDDDMSFSTSEELTKIVEAFARRSGIDVLAFRICDPDTGQLRLREWCHPRSWKDFATSEFETHWFCEGAAAFRRKVFEQSGLYYEPLFYGAEGHDLAIRILDHGFKMLYYPSVSVGHRAANEGRSSGRQYYTFTRAFIWMAYKDYRLLDGLRFLIPKMLMMVYFTVRTGSYSAFLKGIGDGLKGLQRIRRDRTPASRHTLKYWYELERWRPGLVARLARHRTAPQL